MGDKDRTPSSSAFPLPDNLPIPVDDGSCSHLVPGTQIPSIELLSTKGNYINLSSLPGLSVIFCYPKTGVPGQPLPLGWDNIPGARGCTPQSCSFRDHFKELKELGVENLFGLSTQNTVYQNELVKRLHLPFPILSDEKLKFIKSLNLPTFQVPGGEREAAELLVKRVTIVIKDGKIAKIFYPVFPSDSNPIQLIEWLKQIQATNA